MAMLLVLCPHLEERGFKGEFNFLKPSPGERPSQLFLPEGCHLSDRFAYSLPFLDISSPSSEPTSPLNAGGTERRAAHPASALVSRLSFSIHLFPQLDC